MRTPSGLVSLSCARRATKPTMARSPRIVIETLPEGRDWGAELFQPSGKYDDAGWIGVQFNWASADQDKRNVTVEFFYAGQP